jgi:hypothetical protein
LHLLVGPMTLETMTLAAMTPEGVLIYFLQ